MNKSKPIPRFISAVLTEDGHRLLSAAIGTPKFSKVFMHHTTLAYAPPAAVFAKIAATVKEGDTVEIICHDRFWNDGVEAVTVTVKTADGTEVFSANADPHITISTANKPPKESNTMLAKKFYIPKENRDSMHGLRLSAVVTFEV